VKFLSINLKLCYNRVCWREELGKDRPAKLENLLEVIKKHIEEETFRFSKHAIERYVERDITPQDTLYVLLNGYHEKKKDSFDQDTKLWKYSVRGMTQEAEDVRVIVKLVKEMLIITVIKIN